MANLKKRVLDLLSSEPFRALKIKEIQRRLGVPHSEYQELRQIVRSLARQDRIRRFKKGRFGVGQPQNEMTGRLHVNTQGYGFVTPKKGEDIFISQKNMANALHGDTVRLRLFASRKGKSPEGQIVEVLERARTLIVGTFRWGRQYGYLIPDDLKIQRDVIIPPGEESNAQEGQKVVARIEEWEHYGMNPSGPVVEVLGYPDEPGVEMLSLIYKHQLPREFSEKAEKAAKELSEGISAKEEQERLDLRDVECFTIDPVDAKDFDDAVSLEKMENDNWRLGVHIADVSHFVDERSPIEKEARKRGLSVYLIDRAIPMLPERLSSELCSLVPEQDRLTFSVLMQLDPKGHLVSYDIKKTIINSNKRFNYEEAQLILDGEMKSEFADTLNNMYDLSMALVKRRRQRGSIDFDSPEVEIPLNEKGWPVEIKIRQRLNTHRLIEEFMLLANETIARHVGMILGDKLGNPPPFVYRVHAKPDKQEVIELVKLAFAFGIKVKIPKHISPTFFQKLADQFQEHNAASVLNNAMLRTMTKARYDTENIGHFGLAYKYYTHFTSPIRRYADLMVHRLLKEYATSVSTTASKISLKDLQKRCEDSTKREIQSQEAERDSIKLKQIQYMQQHHGKEFTGVIIRILNFGFFVHLPDYLIDGLIHVTSLDDDYYIVDDNNYSMVGQYSGKEYKLGQKMRVQLVRIDPDEHLIDFVPVESMESKKEKKK